MPRLSFTLRYVFWLMLVVAMGVGWWLDCERLSLLRQRERETAESLRDGDNQLSRLIADLEAQGVTVDYSRGGVFMPGEKPPRWPSGLSSHAEPAAQP